jgi:prevent-host-death family protein
MRSIGTQALMCSEDGSSYLRILRIFRSTVVVMVTYTMTQATKQTAEMVNEARYTNQPILITDHGKPAAVVISPHLLAHYQALEDAADLAAVEAIKAGGPDWVANDEAQRLMDEIEADVDGADGTAAGR